MIDRTRVLVVDDEQVVCESCRRALLEEGYEVSTATDPRQGLERAQSENFELVILDLKMPGISGLKVLQGIKEKKPRTVVMMITAYPTAETAVKSGRFGAVQYLLKPFTPDELCEKVREAIRLSEDRTPREHDTRTSAEDDSSTHPGQILVLGARKHSAAIQRMASSERLSIEMAYDAQGVLERVRTGRVEVLVIGLEILGKAAHELIGAVKEINKDITVIVVSSDPWSEFAQEKGEDGIFFFLVEPFSAESIKAAIRGPAARLGPTGRLSREVEQAYPYSEID